MNDFVICVQAMKFLIKQYGCEQCWSSDALVAWRAVTNIPFVARLIDDSHYIVSIRECPFCFQCYLQVTTETIDWLDGEDPIYRTIIPIDTKEQAKLMASIPLVTNVIEEVGSGRQSLIYDWPKEGEPSIYWGKGVFVGEHD